MLVTIKKRDLNPGRMFQLLSFLPSFRQIEHFCNLQKFKTHSLKYNQKDEKREKTLWSRLKILEINRWFWRNSLGTAAWSHSFGLTFVSSKCCWLTRLKRNPFMDTKALCMYVLSGAFLFRFELWHSKQWSQFERICQLVFLHISLFNYFHFQSRFVDRCEKLIQCLQIIINLAADTLVN